MLPGKSHTVSMDYLFPLWWWIVHDNDLKASSLWTIGRIVSRKKYKHLPTTYPLTGGTGNLQILIFFLIYYSLKFIMAWSQLQDSGIIAFDATWSMRPYIYSSRVYGDKTIFTVLSVRSSRNICTDEDNAVLIKLSGLSNIYQYITDPWNESLPG